MASELATDLISDTETEFDIVIDYYRSQETRFVLESFLDQVKLFFEKNPRLHKGSFPVVHSVKARLKDPEHLRDKLLRKKLEGVVVTESNLFENITDLAGVRVLHLYQEQFGPIHKEILWKISTGDWILAETPIAYTWDPESIEYYHGLGINTKLKDSQYTSVHYLVSPNNGSNICCEIQVRTLFEEIWGEIDHAINYPHHTASIACKEQLRVLSKLISTGTRLSDSIFRSYQEYQVNKSDKA